jgi:hypothetical protein
LTTTENVEKSESLWDLEGISWRLVNVFSVKEKMVGAYCPASDFNDDMLTQSRRALIVEYPTVEVASMSDIKIWIAASMEIAELQGSASRGSRPKRRKITNLPRRNLTNVPKWVGLHDACCGLCAKNGGLLQKCYGCNVVVHKSCANYDGQVNVLWLPNGSKQWVCDSCYFDAHGGG